MFFCLQLASLSFGTLAFVEDPWSEVQVAYPVFQLYCMCVGVFLIWQHWTRGPEFDPSPGRVAVPDLQPLWAALSFRNLRRVYARAFMLVYLSSAWSLAKSIGFVTSTNGLTVFGALADCVFPMHPTMDQRRKELIRRGICVMMAGGIFFVISSLTKVFICCYACCSMLAALGGAACLHSPTLCHPKHGRWRNELLCTVLECQLKAS